MPPPREPCSRCGKPVYRSQTSAPVIVCRTCRAEQSAPYKPQRKSYGDPRECALPGCDVIYTPTHAAQRFCSKTCAYRGGRGRVRAPAKTCEICGAQFRRVNRKGHVQRTCSRACGVELRRRVYGFAGAKAPAQPRSAPSSRVYIRNCIWCAKLFVARRESIQSCSKACYDRAYNQCNRPARQQPGEWRCQSCGTPVSDGRNKCDACVAASARQHKQRQRRAERARRHGIKREPYTLDEIALRDRYRCGLCRKRVAMTKTVPHPKAPTIDHVLPIACGGDDTRANVQLAHFSCNARKRTGGSQQLAMIG